mmetsp:Transcript_6695/g.9784  ORF Transcript_6695/g.9784 Transcript_6695/m.9784 type:complete len:215 (+) Transcript_6695:6006-6650(+)
MHLKLSTLLIIPSSIMIKLNVQIFHPICIHILTPDPLHIAQLVQKHAQCHKLGSTQRSHCFTTTVTNTTITTIIITIFTQYAILNFQWVHLYKHLIVVIMRHTWYGDIARKLFLQHQPLICIHNDVIIMLHHTLPQSLSAQGLFSGSILGIGEARPVKLACQQAAIDDHTWVSIRVFAVSAKFGHPFGTNEVVRPARWPRIALCRLIRCNEANM